MGPVPVDSTGTGVSMGTEEVGVGVHLAYRVYRYSSIIPWYSLPSYHPYAPPYPRGHYGGSLPTGQELHEPGTGVTGTPENTRVLVGVGVGVWGYISPGTIHTLVLLDCNH